MIGDYLHWHYVTARKQLGRIHKNFLVFIYHYFSISLLLRTFFAPYRRSYKLKQHAGFSMAEWTDRLTFNLVSRIMGAFVRSFVISVGLGLWIGIFFLGLVALLLWLFAFGFSLPVFFFTRPKDITLSAEIFNNPKALLQQIGSTPWGIFVLQRLNLSLSMLTAVVEPQLELPLQIGTTVSPSRLFFALFDQSSGLKELFSQHGTNKNDLLRIDDWYQRATQNEYKQRAFWELDYLLHIPSIGKRWTYGYTPILDRFTIDLSKEHAHYASFHGRQTELESIERILTKNVQANVFLVGEPTVGKHSLLVHLGHLILQGRVVPVLESKRLLKLDLERLFSTEVDAMQRKATLLYVLEEARSAGNVILVIDEFDRFVSVGPDRIDVSDVFAHEEGKGLQVIAIVLPGAYHQYIAPNKTLTPLFELLEMRSLTPEETLTVICDILPLYEQASVYMLYDAIVELITDSDRLLRDVPFPEKAITVVDQLLTEKKHQAGPGPHPVTVADVQRYFTRTTHVPIALASEERNRLLNLETILHARIIGQDEAVKTVSQALRRTRSSVSHRRDKPIGTLLFLGPTGVGKTETAKALAQVYFGNEASLIRFDMSEFQDTSAIKQFLGDFETGRIGVFSQKISQNPYTVLLLDEIEKANKAILNIFLPALDEGYITDAFGKKLYLTNMIIIATSNAGSEYIREQAVNNPAGVASKTVLDYVQQQGIFAPEFINRFDSVVVFHPLDRKQSSDILELQLHRLQQSMLSEQGITVEISDQTKDRLLAEGFDQTYGGRALSRAIQTLVEEPLAEKILQQQVVRGGKVTV